MIKKNVILILILVLTTMQIISAVEFEMKSGFNQGETLMARLSGNFVGGIFRDNIFLYRGHVRVPFEPYVAEINGDYYIYAQLLDKRPANYSLSIENVKYIKAGEISEENLIKNFTISDTFAEFSISPGFIVTNRGFFVEVQNLKDSEIILMVKVKDSFEEDLEEKGFFASLFGGETSENTLEKSISVKAGETKKIDFKISEFGNSTFKVIELSTDNLKYEIPVVISYPEKKQGESKIFRFEPSELNISLSTNSNTTRIIYLYNGGQEAMSNISLSVSKSLIPYIFVSVSNIDELKENSSVKIELQINASEEEGKFEGQITAKTSNNLYAYSAVFLNFLKDFVPLNESSPETKTETQIFQTCDEIKGQVCKKEEKCDGETKNTKDGVCCLGKCLKKEKSSGRLIGFMVIIAVVILLIWFYLKKYKGVKKPIDLLKIAKGKK
ncbi:hypothetical protein DRN69_02845 [Candidatus Pacearchaeota archaeon]|nr:MAG: hypothetical protein DRN69_02845 [Candidatus Pacearchaeota archaeon]